MTTTVYYDERSAVAPYRVITDECVSLDYKTKGGALWSAGFVPVGESNQIGWDPTAIVTWQWGEAQ
jgi:hypothetical protein